MAALYRGAVSKSSHDGSGTGSSPVHSWRRRLRDNGDLTTGVATANGEKNEGFKLGIFVGFENVEREVDGNEKKKVLGPY